MTVIAAAKFDELIATGVCSCQAQGTHGSLGAGVDEAHHFKRWHAIDHQSCQLILGLGGRAKAKAQLAGLNHCLHHFGMGVPQDHRPPGLHVIEVAIAIHVIEIRSLGSADEDGTTSNSAKGAHRAVDASWEQFLRLLKQRLRTCQREVMGYFALLIHELRSNRFQNLTQWL